MTTPHAATGMLVRDGIRASGRRLPTDPEAVPAFTEEETIMRKLACTGCLAAALALPAPGALADQDTSGIAFPEGYRTWHHHHSTLNMKGHDPDGNVGMQHVYANPAAVAGLKSGKYADGAVFAVDRFAYAEGDNHSIAQTTRKVVAVMVKDARKYAETGGWGFQAFKGGDPNVRAVKDGGKACFTCHIPHADNDYLFTRGLN